MNNHNVEILEESRKIDPSKYFKPIAELIFHLMKYGDQDPSQKARQGRSWIESIFKQHKYITQALENSNVTGNFKKEIDNQYNKKILDEVNACYRHDKLAYKQISRIPADYSFENITNPNWIVSYLLMYACTIDSVNYLEGAGIQVPPEVYKRCKSN